MNTKRAAILAAALLAAGPVHAGTFKDGPFAGYVMAGDVEDAGPAFGWQAAYEYNRHSSLELLFSWHEDETREGLDFDVWSLALAGRVGFVPHRSTRVYGGAGLGYYMLRADNEQVRIRATDEPQDFSFAEVRFDKDFGANLLGGVEVRLTERWELFGEFRYVFFETDARFTTARTGDSAVNRVTEPFPYDFAMLRLGLNYRF